MYQFLQNLLRWANFGPYSLKENTGISLIQDFTLLMLLYLDNEAPNISCVADQLSETGEGKPTAMAIWEDPLASDNSGNVSVTCDPPTGTNFAIGQSTVTCKAIDGSGNTAPCSFQVNVTGKMCSQNL